MLTLSNLRREVSYLTRKAHRVLHRLRTPIGPDEMRSTLNQLIEGGSEILFVHASLSSCGRFTGGPGDVLSGLSEFCDTLGFPTHTYCYPLSSDEVGPLFNPLTTPSKTGRLTEIFRMQSGTLRSIHATHSLAAAGARAEEICSNHHRHDTPCGAETPYSRLVQRRAAVLLFGVTFHCYTLFHTAEDASGSEFAYEHGRLDRLRVVDERGEQHDCWSKRQSRVARRFEDAGRLLKSVGLVRRVTLGRADLLYVPDCSRVHDFLVERLRKTPDFLYRSCTRSLQ
jgi:aminoglycoside 3-N-acetyltransferase